jgi:hypothetical protein
MTIAGAAVAVFMLAMALLVSAAIPTPAAAADHCMACHPQAHTADWTQTHGTELTASEVSATTCADCHTVSYCDTCHAPGTVALPATGS